MRIITGKNKGQKIIAPKGKDFTRPALSKVREAIFSSLGDVTGLTFMDVFAGCGSLGFEALSRGAASCAFIENHPKAIQSLIINIKNLGLGAQARIYKRTLPFGLKDIKNHEPLDVIFCDPPYDNHLINKTLRALIKYNFISDDTLIIVEHTKREMPLVENLKTIKEKKFGQTLITYLKRFEPDDQQVTSEP